MIRQIKVHIEQTEAGFWPYQQRSAGRLPETSFHQVLLWIVQQLNFGCMRLDTQHNGDVVSMTIGRQAALPLTSMEDAEAHAKLRLMSVNFAEVFARARESGIKPKHVSLADRVKRELTINGERNTEIHYVFELLKVLGRLNKKVFKLEPPPIVGVAPSSVISYLLESTRCWLYGFYGASVALCRACLEDALKAKLETSAELAELIELARQAGHLDACMAEFANEVRKTGNRFLHGEAIDGKQAREAIDRTRGLLEHLFRP